MFKIISILFALIYLSSCALVSPIVHYCEETCSFYKKICFEDQSIDFHEISEKLKFEKGIILGKTGHSLRSYTCRNHEESEYLHLQINRDTYHTKNNDFENFKTTAYVLIAVVFSFFVLL